jgi:hypothetical protein
VTDNIVITKRKDFYKLFSIMEREIRDASITLHLEVDSLAPIDILIITQFLIIQSQRNCIITLSTNPRIKEYVKAIKLVDFVKSNIHKPTTIRAIPDFTAMPIRRVERGSMVEYINATEQYFKGIISGSKDLAMLNLSMSELINNVYDHSFSSIGAYVFCQYYPESNEIKIAVSDYGIGIPKSVNNYRLKEGKPPLSDIDSVKWSLKENRSTYSIPQNAGRGLDNVNSFVRKNKGNWKLISGNASLNGQAGRNSYSENFIYGFKGTVVQISIRIDNLYDVDIIENLNWDL